MDSITDPAVKTVVVMSSAQVGKTEILNNLIGFHIDHDPAPILVIQPNVSPMAESWSKDRLQPMLRDSPCLRGKVRDPRSRDSNNTVLHKVFPGGHITIAGANSPAGLASRPIRIVICDEVDKYPPSAGASGDPVTLASKRSMTFWNRKLVLTSTPTIKDVSRIEAAYLSSDQRRFYISCPKCSYSQTPIWAQVKWEKDRPETAAYHCESCQARWSEGERLAAVMDGKWKASKPFNGTAGFHLNALVSPWAELPLLARDFLNAKDYPDMLKTFVNETLGEVWEDQGAKVEDGSLLARRENYGPDVPAAVAVITVGVDVQDDRLELEVLGWGRGEENWSLDYRVIRGDPTTGTPWKDLDDLLLRPYRRADGIELRVAATAVDSGGHATNSAYSYCKDRYARRVWAIKGASKPGQPIWPRKPTRSNIGRVNLFIIGVDAAKDLVMGRLRIDKPGNGYSHFPADRSEDYFAQLTAERCVTTYSRGHPVRKWVKRDHARNEALDCRCYAVAAFAGLVAMGLDLDRELDRLATVANAIQVKAPIPGTQPYQRRVRSAGVTL